jgi:signal transduction histidine kinase
MRKPPAHKKTTIADVAAESATPELAALPVAEADQSSGKPKRPRRRTVKVESPAPPNTVSRNGTDEAMNETAFPSATVLEPDSRPRQNPDGLAAAEDAFGSSFVDLVRDRLIDPEEVEELEAFPDAAQAFETLAPPADIPPQQPAHAHHLLKRNGRARLSKRVAGAVRPHGTRQFGAGRVPKLDRASSRSVAAALASGTDPNFSEFEEILSRMVERIAKFLQAEKCVFLLHDAGRSELQAVSPARGFTSEELADFTTSTRGKGLAAWVFRRGAEESKATLPGVILGPREVETDARAIADKLAERFGVRSSLTVPLIIENRNDNNDIISKDTVGVAHVFNKVSEGGFTENDRTLLVTMSRTAASIFSSAKAFREVVYEKQELIQTLDSLYVGLLMVGLDGRIMQINPAARNVLALGDEASVVGRHYAGVVRNESFKRILDQSLEGIEPVELTGEVVVRTETEERIYQAHCAPVKNQEHDSTVGLLVLMNDVTEIRGVDRMKTAFISTVSHELRTPLTSIKGFVATLLDDTEGFYTKEDQREFYEIINNDCDRLTRLIDDLLNVSRIEQGRAMQLKLEKVDIPAIAAKVLAALRASTLPERHRLTMNFDDDFPAVEADPDKIDQILTNLVNNAIKYTPRGGPVVVTGGRDADGRHVHVTVCDRGLGIPREHLKKIFDRFHRVDNRDNREIGGTGIGLYLVKALIDSHHGAIKVESDLGKGSLFTITLPIKQPASAKGE